MYIDDVLMPFITKLHVGQPGHPVFFKMPFEIGCSENANGELKYLNDERLTHLLSSSCTDLRMPYPVIVLVGCNRSSCIYITTQTEAQQERWIAELLVVCSCGSAHVIVIGLEPSTSSVQNDTARSEERRVGKECRSRWS